MEDSKLSPCECMSGHSRKVHCVYPKRLPWLVACSQCGLWSVSPQPSQSELDEIYGRNYFQSFGANEGYSEGFHALKRGQASRYLEYITNVASGSRLLDVGCALGDMVVVARQSGWQAFGIDVNPWAVEATNRIEPGTATNCTIEEFARTGKTMDVITCLEVIEHVRRPDQTLRLMHDILRPGGVLLITTPDLQSWRRRTMRSRWYHFHRDHLWYFDRKTLTRVVEDAEFEVLHWESARKRFNLGYILNVLASSPSSTLLRSIAKAAKLVAPISLQNCLLPSLTEGQLLIARCRKGI